MTNLKIEDGGEGVTIPALRDYSYLDIQVKNHFGSSGILMGCRLG
jgi:hypothetical protein